MRISAFSSLSQLALRTKGAAEGPSQWFRVALTRPLAVAAPSFHSVCVNDVGV